MTTPIRFLHFLMIVMICMSSSKSFAAAKADLAAMYSDSRIFAWPSTGTDIGYGQWWTAPGGFTTSMVTDRFVAGDFNGDGKDDIAAMYDYGASHSRIFVWPSSGAAFGYQSWWEVPSGFTAANVAGRFVAGDFNGDGMDDIAAMYDYGAGHSRIFVWKSTGTSFVYQSWWDRLTGFTAAQVTNRFVAGDFNNDGKDDIAAMYDYGGSHSRIFVWPSTGAAFGYQSWWEVLSGFVAGNVSNRFVAGDFNADGRDDVAAMYDYGGSHARLFVWPSNGSAFGYQSWWESFGFSGAATSDRFVAGDLTGDGKSDLAAMYSDNRIFVWPSTGTAFGYANWWSSTGFTASATTGRFVAGNFSGDGMFSISGKVGVAGATVKAGNRSDVTDAAGNYSLLGLPAGTYSVTVTKSGCSFVPSSQSITLSANRNGVDFSAPCSLSFPRGANSYADNYIANFPYSSYSTSTNLRWQIQYVSGRSDNGQISAKQESCGTSYRLYSTGYGWYGINGDCSTVNGWVPGYQQGKNSDGSYCCDYPHPRPDFSAGNNIWMNGLNGNDNAGFDFTATGGGYHEISDKIIVMDPLGKTPRNTSCSYEAACGSFSCPKQYWSCSQLLETTTVTFWGVAARKVYPGEIRPDYWGIVPTDSSTYRWQILVSTGDQLGGGPDKIGKGIIERTTSVVDPRAVVDGVFGGGKGPKCAATATACYTVYSRGHDSRVKVQQIDGEWYAFITGYASNADGIVRNTADVSNDMAALSGAGTVHETMYHTINFLNQLGIGDTVHLVGHSLGALDVVTLYNLGYGRSATGLSVPFLTPFDAMKPKASALSGFTAAQRPVRWATAGNDLISNQPASSCGPATSTHGCRAGHGITELVCNNGSGFTTFNNPHDRNKYQACVGGVQW